MRRELSIGPKIFKINVILGYLCLQGEKLGNTLSSSLNLLPRLIYIQPIIRSTSAFALSITTQAIKSRIKQ